MRALVWVKPHTFEMKKLDIPSAAPGEVMLNVKYSGICGSDLSGFIGENSLRKPPLIMGHEFTGEVHQIGEGVDHVSVGDLVTVNPLISCGKCRMCRKGSQQNCVQRQVIGIHRPGAFAEYVAVPAASCYKTTDELSGSLVEPLACGIRAASQAQVQLGDSVVVFGAGVIGLFSLKAARLLGASQCIVVDTNEHRLRTAKEFGATHTINPLKENLVSRVQEIANGPVDRVIDAVGLPLTRQQGIEIIRNGGRVIFIGLHEDETLLLANTIVRREIEVVGSFCYSDEDFLQALSLIENKIVVPNDTWLDIRPLEQGQASFEEQLNGSARFPKIILSPILN